MFGIFFMAGYDELASERTHFLSSFFESFYSLLLFFKIEIPQRKQLKSGSISISSCWKDDTFFQFSPLQIPLYSHYKRCLQSSRAPTFFLIKKSHIFSHNVLEAQVWIWTFFLYSYRVNRKIIFLLDSERHLANKCWTDVLHVMSVRSLINLFSDVQIYRKKNVEEACLLSL